MITELQKKTAKAIVNIFETSKIQGDYSAVTILEGDKGHLSYGIAQVSLTSGNLHNLIDEYIKADGEYKEELLAYLPRMKNKDITLDDDKNCKLILKQAGHDKIMQDCQDDFFDKDFWASAMHIMLLREYKFPLSAAILYDSKIHGAYATVRDIVNKKYGYEGFTNTEETEWIHHYIIEREKWLSENKNPLLKKTAYRMQEFEKLLAVNNWDLILPITVRGLEIIEEALG